MCFHEPCDPSRASSRRAAPSTVPRSSPRRASIASSLAATPRDRRSPAGRIPRLRTQQKRREHDDLRRVHSALRECHILDSHEHGQHIAPGSSESGHRGRERHRHISGGRRPCANRQRCGDEAAIPRVGLAWHRDEPHHAAASSRYDRSAAVRSSSAPRRPISATRTSAPVLGIQPAIAPPSPPPTPAAPANAPRPAAPAATGFGRLNQMALIQGHGGVGVVEAVGPDVRRVQVGDRVCVSGTPQCGSCYQCLRGRADMCQFLGRQGPDDLVPIADMSDGTPVYANSHIGGLAEKMVDVRRWVVPIFTKAAAADLGMVCSCVERCRSRRDDVAERGARRARLDRRGRRMRPARTERCAGRTHLRRIDDHRDRSRFARGASVAMKIGATHALDPNEGDATRRLSARLRAGRTTGSGQADAIPVACWGRGRDFVIEAVGADAVAPSSKQVPIPRASFRCARPTR